MKIMFSNYGHRYWARLKPEERAQAPYALELGALWDATLLNGGPDAAFAALLEQGLIREAPAGISVDEAKLLLKRNPLENLSSLVYEFTNRCNLSCMHCRMADDRHTTETDLELLKSAGEDFLRIGITRFDFIGGEVSKYADGWLDLSRHLRDNGAKIVLLLTSGWFLEAENFVAAGKTYVNEAAYLQDLKESGVTHVCFSIDGPEELHDRWRRRPGLYRRIMDGLSRVAAAGLKPRVSLITRDSNPQDNKNFRATLLEAATEIYGDRDAGSPERRMAYLAMDKTNYMSNFIDVGFAVDMKAGGYALDSIPDDVVRCKNFFRPAPALRIRSNGELAVCPLLDSGEGYGNLHKRPLIEILNGMADSFVYKIHAEKRIANYRQFMDRELFGETFEHVCGLRTVLTLIARHMFEENIPEDADPIHHKDALRQINEKVARDTGYIK